MTESQVSEFECGMCGLNGGPVEGCELCNGNPRLRQTRSYTLTEERAGKNPDHTRYGRTGNVAPKIVVLPGGFNPHGQPPTTPDTQD